MPPGRHSSSSHSSSSHSSSSRSSSSSSRSSYSSSSRSGSSSSRSSYSSSSRSGSGSLPSRSPYNPSYRSSSSRGPSPHSSTSRSSTPASRSVSSGPSRRPRVNQPMGFRDQGSRRPTYYYGMRHDYVYYPVAWVDEHSGVSYQPGYYDENGRHYDNVAFQKDGKYENVVCQCPYCGQQTVLNLDAAAVAGQSLNCPSCGAPMDIQSELDEIQSQSRPAENTHTYASEESLRRFNQPRKRKKKTIWIVLAVLALLYGIGRAQEKKPVSLGNPLQQFAITQNSGDTEQPWGDTLYLVRLDGNSYRIQNSPGDKNLALDGDGNFYDADSECWIWLNNDVDPAVWQYWYEGISSDFGDYGWMEHDADGWFIEASEGNWIALPSGYDTSGLWYIQD